LAQLGAFHDDDNSAAGVAANHNHHVAPVPEATAKIRVPSTARSRQPRRVSASVPEKAGARRPDSDSSFNSSTRSRVSPLGCGLRLELDGVRVIDCAGIFFKKEPRKLEDAVRRFAPAFSVNHASHTAASDAMAALEVFRGEMAAYPDLAAMSLDELAEYSRMSERKEADLAGKLYIDSDGDLCFGFGKHRDRKVRFHGDYAEWVFSNEFPGSTKDWLRTELQRLEGVSV
jgi:hypothetical protein